MTDESDIKELDVEPVEVHNQAACLVQEVLVEQGHKAIVYNTKAEDGVFGLVVISDFDGTYTVPSTDGGVHKVSVRTKL